LKSNERKPPESAIQLPASTPNDPWLLSPQFFASIWTATVLDSQMPMLPHLGAQKQIDKSTWKKTTAMDEPGTNSGRSQTQNAQNCCRIRNHPNFFPEAHNFRHTTRQEIKANKRNQLNQLAKCHASAVQLNPAHVGNPCRQSTQAAKPSWRANVPAFKKKPDKQTNGVSRRETWRALPARSSRFPY
jgi:hypothetical protein